MPLVSGQINNFGAVVDVSVGVSPSRRAVLVRNGLAIPPEIVVRAIIDTGSHLTGFRSSVYEKLQIASFRTIAVRTTSTSPGDPHHAYQYDVSVSLVSGITKTPFGRVYAIACDDFNPDAEEGLEAILGRDVLDRCDFQYFGPSKQFNLGF